MGSIHSHYFLVQRAMNFERLYLWQKCRLMAKQQRARAQIQTWILYLYSLYMNLPHFQSSVKERMWFDQMQAVMWGGWCPSKDNGFGSWGFGKGFKLNSISCFKALLNKDIMYNSGLIWIFFEHDFSPLIKYHKVSNKDITKV